MSEFTEYHFVRCRDPQALADQLSRAGIEGQLLLPGVGIDTWCDPGDPGIWAALATPAAESAFAPVTGPWVGLYRDERSISWRLTAGAGGEAEIDLYFTDPDDADEFEEEAPLIAAAIRRGAEPSSEDVGHLEQILQKSRDFWRAHLDEFGMQKFLDANGMPYLDILDRTLVETNGGIELIWLDRVDAP